MIFKYHENHNLSIIIRKLNVLPGLIHPMTHVVHVSSRLCGYLTIDLQFSVHQMSVQPALLRMLEGISSFVAVHQMSVQSVLSRMLEGISSFVAIHQMSVQSVLSRMLEGISSFVAIHQMSVQPALSRINIC